MILHYLLKHVLMDFYLSYKEFFNLSVYDLKITMTFSPSCDFASCCSSNERFLVIFEMILLFDLANKIIKQSGASVITQLVPVNTQKTHEYRGATLDHYGSLVVTLLSSAILVFVCK